MGVVYYANYLTWFEVARTEAFRSAGFSYADYEAHGIYLPVVEASCRYLTPARYDDLISIYTQVTNYSPVRLEFQYEIKRGDTTLANGQTKHAFVNKEGRPVNLKKLGLFEPIKQLVERQAEQLVEG